MERGGKERSGGGGQEEVVDLDLGELGETGKIIRRGFVFVFFYLFFRYGRYFLKGQILNDGNSYLPLTLAVCLQQPRFQNGLVTG